jgi:cell division septum initiation protein DivIVA
MSAVESQEAWGPLTPEDIRTWRFLPAGHGYDRADVRGFLFQLAELVADLQRQIDALQPVPPAPTPQHIAAETGRILQDACDAAEDTRRRAGAIADAELAEAARHAAELVGDAQLRRHAAQYVVRLLEEHRAAIARKLGRLRRGLETSLTDLGPPPSGAAAASRPAPPALF